MTNRSLYLISWLLMGLGIIAMGIGLTRGEGTVLFTKATAICLECIGIG